LWLRFSPVRTPPRLLGAIVDSFSASVQLQLQNRRSFAL
jgi:hypothetical protein